MKSSVTFLRMTVHHIIWSIGVGILFAQVLIQSMPMPSEVLSRPTVLSAMKTELTSAYGTCSFPPKDVLSNVYNFDFLEPCDRKIPPVNASTSDESLIRCLGLLEVGLRLCSLDQEYFVSDGPRPSLLLRIPNDSHSFTDLVEELNGQNDSNLCSDLKTVGLLGGIYFPQLNGWSLNNVFQETVGSCSRICYDIKNNGNILCKLILWGNKLLGPQHKPFKSSIGNNTQANTLRVSKVMNLPTNNLVAPLKPGSASVGLDLAIQSKTPGLESEGLDLGLDQQPKDLVTNYNRQESSIAYIDDANTHITDSDRQHARPSQNIPFVQDSGPRPSSSIKDPSKPASNAVSNAQGGPGPMSSDIDPNEVGVDLGVVSRPSVQDITSMAIHQVDNAENINPGQAVPRTDITNHLNKSDVGLKQNISKLTSNSGEQELAPNVLSGLSDVVKAKEIDGPPPKSTHHEQDTSGSQDQVSSRTEPTTSIEAKPDAIVNDNLSANPIGKPIPDIGLDRDEIGEHYDASLDQNQDGDDDINFPEVEQEQPEMSHEPTGHRSNTNYKNPREEFTDDSAFMNERFEDSEDSHFFTYFMTMIVVCIVGYVVFHNKQKIMALALEGRSRRTSRRRPVSANYHKLDNNLEEAVSSPCSTSVTHVIY